MLMFGWDFEVSVVNIMKQKFDQDLCLNLWYDPLGYFGKMNSTLGSVVPLAMFPLRALGKKSQKAIPFLYCIAKTDFDIFLKVKMSP